MKKLVLLVAVLALCMPSFGARQVVVYEGKMNVSNFGFDVNDTNTIGTVKSVTSNKVDAFLIADINTTTLAIEVPEVNGVTDVNNLPLVVLKIGKSKKDIVTYRFSAAAVDSFSQKFKVTGAKKVSFVQGLEIQAEDPNYAVDLSGEGKVTSSTIGSGKTKIDLAKSLKGTGDAQHFIKKTGDNPRDSGDAACTITLNKKLTDKATTVKATAALIE